jgi:hypothetical protein
MGKGMAQPEHGRRLMNTRSPGPWIIANPDSDAARNWYEAEREYEQAMERCYGSAPKNRPERYITLREVAQRIGIKQESMETNATNRPRYFPFQPVPGRGSRNGPMVRYYDRAEVDIWIARYNERKAQHAARSRGREAGWGDSAQPEHVP